ncbi:MAG: hypothetical protein CL608_14495 [Anaerolineaceae bacterium]|nr:hypothetical protein [Anaerolineaceae bacterium]
MSLPDTHKKERLHSAYIRAIIAHAGQNLMVASEGDYGIDGAVKEIVKFPVGEKSKYISTGHVFEFQLKATQKCKMNDKGEVIYSLDDNAHFRFTKYNGVIPSVLIVYDMPDDVSGCVLQNIKKLEMMGCCYWKFMDKDTLEMKTVYIPSNQIFNAEAVNYILNYYGQELRKLRNVSST